MCAARAHAAATRAEPSRAISSDVARLVVEIQAQHGAASHDQRPAIVGQQWRNNGRRCATTRARLLRHPTLEGLTRSARTDYPRQVGRNKFRRRGGGVHRAAAAMLMRGGGGALKLGLGLMVV
ncbi:hypothetical protein F511_44989 [Dorcoceras hygrometricum]|uniref:Uncharacterized protein n=1 Tax=Dorcoceras hygrometricum TaxID=472368 RepID=A0A2Z7A4V3_9LAMI|nr:hypothetical protein F511_44989 [Dorcoceras hygrometricum]